MLSKRLFSCYKLIQRKNELVSKFDAHRQQYEMFKEDVENEDVSIPLSIKKNRELNNLLSRLNMKKVNEVRFDNES